MGEIIRKFRRVRAEDWERGHVIIPARADEMKWLELMMCYSSQLGEGYAGDVIKRRAEACGQKRVWAMWRCAEGMILKVMDMLYGTLPYKNMLHILDMAENGEIHMSVRTVNRHEKGNTLVNNHDLTVILNAALAAECDFCMKEGNECSRCELRKILQVYLPPNELPTGSLCPYAHARID